MTLSELKDDYNIPVRFIKCLNKLKALPDWWFEVSSSKQKDWLSDFHKNLLQADFSDEIRQTSVGVTNSGINSFAIVNEGVKIISISVQTILLMNEIVTTVLELINKMTPPNSTDPNAKMFVGIDVISDAKYRVRESLSYLHFLGCVKISEENPFSPLVISAAHFTYCHELGHIYIHSQKQEKYDMQTEEFECDKRAFTMMFSTYKSSSIYQELFAFSGPAIALLVEFYKSIASGNFSKKSNTHPLLFDRYRELARICLLCEENNMLEQGSFAMGHNFWQIIKDRIDEVFEEGYVTFNPFGKIFYPLIQHSFNKSDLTLINQELIRILSFGKIDLVKKSLFDELDNIKYTQNPLTMNNLRILLQSMREEFSDLDETINWNGQIDNLLAKI
jgi:Peptidase U49